MPAIPPLRKYPEGNTGVFWDVEDYPIRHNLDSEFVYRNIARDLRRSGYYGDVSVHFFVPVPELMADFHPKIKTTVLPRGYEPPHKTPPLGVFLDLTDLHDVKTIGLLFDKVLELVRKEGGSFYVHAMCFNEDMLKDVRSKYVHYPFLVHTMPTKEALIWMLDAALYWTMWEAEPGQVRQPVKILLLSNSIQNDDHPNLALVRSCLEKLGCSLAWARPNTLIND